MYPTANDNPVKDDVVEIIVEVGDDERGPDAVDKASDENPEMTAFYVGLVHHDL